MSVIGGQSVRLEELTDKISEFCLCPASQEHSLAVGTLSALVTAMPGQPQIGDGLDGPKSYRNDFGRFTLLERQFYGTKTSH